MWKYTLLTIWLMVSAIFAPARAEDLIDLLEAGKVEVAVTGSSIEIVEIRVRAVPSASLPITVDIPAGAFFDAGGGSAQNMVATESRSIRLSNTEWREVSLPAACASRLKDIPGQSDRFSVKRLPQQAELARAASALAAAGASSAVKQAAIWIISDDATYDDLGELIEGYSEYSGTRVIDETVAARALRILASAGIDITTKRIWRDKTQILRGITDPDLKQWLSSR